MKYKVTAQIKTDEVLYGIKLKKGIGYTDNSYLAGVLSKEGFKVEDAEKKVKEDADKCGHDTLPEE